MRFGHLLLAAATLTGTGCVGVPFAVPPARLEVGGGVRNVERGRVVSGPPLPKETVDTPLEVSFGVHPLGFGRELLYRRVDIGVGYIYQAGALAKVHGGYLEAQGMIGRWAVAPDTVVRVGARAQLRMLGEQGHSLLGRGGSFGGFVELAGFGKGTFGEIDRNGGVMGVSYGEGGIGLAIDGAYADIGGATVKSLTGGLTVRIPILAGFAFRWLWADKK